jgi:hypothetical protein
MKVVDISTREGEISEDKINELETNSKKQEY